ncbi:hypothetical protein [Phosphitispora sp. TUW77]|uniref:hypothetical protein n=1 Tax=Phosphitispora sp. TUW77 TaxID=3152361 RepID=UPI003AB7B158
MSNILFSPDLPPLIIGVKPYLPLKGQNLADGVLSLIELLSSMPAQEAAKKMSRLFQLAGNRSITVDTSLGPITLALDSAFLLFLILILLILSGNLLSI